MIEVEGPDGSIFEFPDETDPAVISGAVRRFYQDAPAAGRKVADHVAQRTGARRNWGQRFLDNAEDGLARSGLGQLSRRVNPDGDGGIGLDDIVGGVSLTDGGLADRALDALAGDDRRFLKGTSALTPADQRERQRRADYDAKAAADPIRNAGDTSAFLAGQITGALLSPENWAIPGGGTILRRALAQGGVSAAADVALQAGDIGSGVQDEFSPLQTAAAGGLGMALNGGAELAVKGARSLTSKFLRKPEADFRPELETEQALHQPAMTGDDLGVTIELADGTVVGSPRAEAPEASPAGRPPADQPETSKATSGDLEPPARQPRADAPPAETFDTVDWGRIGSRERAQAAQRHIETLRKLIKPEAVGRFMEHLEFRESAFFDAPRHINPDYVDWDALEADPALIDHWAKARAEIFKDVYDGAGDARAGWAQTEKASKVFGQSLSQLAMTHAQLVGEGGVSARLGALVDVAVEHDARFAKFLNELQPRLDDGTATPQDMAEFARLTQQVTLIDAMAAGASSEVGRALNYLKRMKTGRGMVNDIQAAMDAMGGDASPDAMKEAVRKMREAYAKNGAGGLRSEVRKVRQMGFTDYVGYILTGNLLSAPATHLRNLLGTPLHMVFQVSERYVAAGFGAVRGKVGSVDRVTFREANAYAYAVTKSLGEAALVGAQAFRNGQPVFDGRSSVLPGENLGGQVPFAITPARIAGWRTDPAKGLLDAPTALLFATVRTFAYRPSVAVDEALKVVSHRMQLSALAMREAQYRAARAEPGDSKQVFDRTLRAFEEDPTAEAIAEAQAFFRENGLNPQDVYSMNSKAEDMALILQSIDVERMARDHARLVTFQKTGKIVDQIDRTLGMLPLIKYLSVNFVRTPMNLLRAGLVDRNPFTAWMLSDNRAQFQHLFAAGRDQELAMKRGGAEADLAVARLITGAGLMVWAWTMWSNGDLVGRQGEPGEARDGRLDYSIRIPGTKEWVQYSTMSPLAEPLGLIADVAQTLRDHDVEDSTAESLIGGLVAALANNVTNKSFMAGLDDLMDIMSGPSFGTNDDARGKAVGSSVAALVAPRVVPLASLFRAAAYESDPVVRDARTLMERVKATFPVWSESLPAKRDFMGKPLVRKPGERGVMQAWKTSRVLDDDVTEEVYRLAQATKGDFKLKLPPRKFNGQPINSEEYSRLLEVQGQLFVDPDTGWNMEAALRNLVGSAGYAGLPEGLKADVIKKTISWYRKQAKAELNDPESPLYWGKVTQRTQAGKLKELMFDEGLTPDEVIDEAETYGLTEDDLGFLEDTPEE